MIRRPPPQSDRSASELTQDILIPFASSVDILDELVRARCSNLELDCWKKYSAGLECRKDPKNTDLETFRWCQYGADYLQGLMELEGGLVHTPASVADCLCVMLSSHRYHPDQYSDLSPSAFRLLFRIIGRQPPVKLALAPSDVVAMDSDDEGIVTTSVKPPISDERLMVKKKPTAQSTRFIEEDEPNFWVPRAGNGRSLLRIGIDDILRACLELVRTRPVTSDAVKRAFGHVLLLRYVTVLYGADLDPRLQLAQAHMPVACQHGRIRSMLMNSLLYRTLVTFDSAYNPRDTLDLLLQLIAEDAPVRELLSEDAESLPPGGDHVLTDVISMALKLLELMLGLYGALEDCGALAGQHAAVTLGPKKFRMLDQTVELITKTFAAREMDCLLHALPARDRVRLIAMMTASAVCMSSYFDKEYHKHDELRLLKCFFSTMERSKVDFEAAATYADVPPAYIGRLLVNDTYKVCEWATRNGQDDKRVESSTMLVSWLYHLSFATSHALPLLADEKRFVMDGAGAFPVGAKPFGDTMARFSAGECCSERVCESERQQLLQVVTEALERLEHTFPPSTPRKRKLHEAPAMELCTPDQNAGRPQPSRGMLTPVHPAYELFPDDPNGELKVRLRTAMTWLRRGTRRCK